MAELIGLFAIVSLFFITFAFVGMRGSSSDKQEELKAKGKNSWKPMTAEQLQSEMADVNHPCHPHRRD